jgi:hydroxyacylglutathione hydrolase
MSPGAVAISVVAQSGAMGSLGHTWESISVLVREHPGVEPPAVLTVDYLFIGDVGRPDLVNIGDSSTTDLARDVSLDPRHAACPAGPGDRHARPRCGRRAARTCQPNALPPLANNAAPTRRYRR